MIYNFQAMRAVAALLVTFVHINIFVAASGLTHRHLAFGNFGVDLFFVLSGFVIVHSTAKSDPTAGGFMAGRIVRVVPIYWLLTLAVFAVALATPQLLGATTADPLDLAKSLFFIPYMKENGLIQPVLFVGWTLNYEMFFYTSFALFLLLARRNLNATVILTSLFIGGFALAVQIAQPDSLVLRFFGYPIVLEFVMGMWIALAARRWPEQASPLAGPVMGLAAFCLLLHIVVVADAPRWLAAGVPSAAILWAALMFERRGRVLSGRIMQLLGAASYSLYLSHPFVLKSFGKLIEPVNGPVVGIFAALISIALAHLVGVAIHLKIERPVVDWLRGKNRTSPSIETGKPLTSLGARR